MKNLFIISLLLLSVFSCKKPPPKPAIPATYEDGIVVLNEGLFEQNNASLTFYNGTETFQLVFKSENSRGLGDTANDFETADVGTDRFIIVAVDVSSQVEIINRTTLESVAQIPLFDGANAREPRRIEVFGTKAFVCNYDGTVAVIDLITQSLIELITVGANPDGMVSVGEKLYVSNSGGLNFPIYDSTVSVINMVNHTVEATFETRINCTEMAVDSQGEIYLVSNGNYTDIDPALLRINTADNTILESIDISASSISIYGDWLYFYDEDADAIKKINTLTETVDPSIIIDVSGYETFYGFQLDIENNRIFCMDANGYVNSSTITAYSITGDYLFDFQGGLNSTELIFNN